MRQHDWHSVTWYYINTPDPPTSVHSCALGLTTDATIYMRWNLLKCMSFQPIHMQRPYQWCAYYMCHMGFHACVLYILICPSICSDMYIYIVTHALVNSNSDKSNLVHISQTAWVLILHQILTIESKNRRFIQVYIHESLDISVWINGS